MSINIQETKHRKIVKKDGKDGLIKFFQQKPNIIDKEKRIMRVVVSDGTVDRDGDIIEPTKWTKSSYDIPFMDAHKSSAKVGENKYGDVVNQFETDGKLYNDIQFMNPTIDHEGNKRSADEWAEVEKIANSLWIRANKGEDFRFSVGFFFDPDKVKQIDTGYKFEGQEQYELSLVLVPANVNAGTKAVCKSLSDENKTLDDIFTNFESKAVDYDSIPKSEVDLRTQIYKAVKEVYPNVSCYIMSVRTSTFILNLWGDDSNGNWYDKYYEIGYTVNEITGVTLSEDKIEVTDVQVWVRKELENSGIIKSVETLTKELNEVKNIAVKANVGLVKKSLTPKLKKTLNKIDNGKKTLKKLNVENKED